jgi:hypothetical protein
MMQHSLNIATPDGDCAAHGDKVPAHSGDGRGSAVAQRSEAGTPDVRVTRRPYSERDRIMY